MSDRETKGQPEPEPAKWIVVNGPERQEKLVEALERANDVLARLFSVDNGVSVNEVQEAHREIEAALAAARERGLIAFKDTTTGGAG